MFFSKRIYMVVAAPIVFGVALLLVSAAQAQSLVPAHINGWVQHSGQHGDFTYDNNAPNDVVVGPSSLGPFNGFTFVDPDTNGGGTGYHFTNNNNAPFDQDFVVPIEPVDFSFTDANGVNAFDALDRGAFGANFNASEYSWEVVFKTNAGNTARDFNVMLEQHDGFETDSASADFGKRRAEQLQWSSVQSGLYDADGGEGINDFYAAAAKDADGFATIRIPMSIAPQFTGQSFLFADGTPAFAAAGDGLADLDAFEGRIPNGAGQVHLQAPFNDDGEVLDVEVKDLRIVPTVRNPTVVGRFDAKSGVSRRFNSPFFVDNGAGEFLEFDHDNDNGAATDSVIVFETDQVQRFDENGFTNLIIQTDDDQEFGVVGAWQDHLYQTFNGDNATLTVTAKLTSHNTAPGIEVVLNDLDGQDDGPGTGAEEMKFFVDFTLLNDTTFTTLTFPVSSPSSIQDSGDTTNGGDGSVTDFNLYYMGLVTNVDVGLIGLEIESIQVTVDAADSGDFDQDGDVDGAGFLAWQRNFGTNNGVRPVLDAGDADYDGDVDGDDLAIWQDQYGAGVVGQAAAASVPEPSSILTALIGVAALSLRRRSGSTD